MGELCRAARNMNDLNAKLWALKRKWVFAMNIY